MKFRIVETPDSDKENEGRFVGAEEARKLLGYDPDSLSVEEFVGNCFLAVSVKRNGYTLEIHNDGELV